MSSDPVGAPIRLGPESQSPLPTRTWLQARSQKCEGRQTHSLTFVHCMPLWRKGSGESVVYVLIWLVGFVLVSVSPRLHCLNQRKAMWMIFELSLTAPIEYGDCESYGGGQWLFPFVKISSIAIMRGRFVKRRAVRSSRILGLQRKFLWDSPFFGWEPHSLK